MNEHIDTNTLHDLLALVWDTRTGCIDHYPVDCPNGCPNVGKHDAELAELGACECPECRSNRHVIGKGEA